MLSFTVHIELSCNIYTQLYIIIYTLYIRLIEISSSVTLSIFRRMERRAIEDRKSGDSTKRMSLRYTAESELQTRIERIRLCRCIMCMCVYVCVFI